MKHLALAAVVALLVLAGTDARAQATPTLVFATVDAVDLDSSAFMVTGILKGEATPTTRGFYLYSSSSSAQMAAEGCERKALLAMSKPGQYLLEVRGTGSGYLDGCRLTRVAP